MIKLIYIFVIPGWTGNHIAGLMPDQVGHDEDRGCPSRSGMTESKGRAVPRKPPREIHLRPEMPSQVCRIGIGGPGAVKLSSLGPLFPKNVPLKAIEQGCPFPMNFTDAPDLIKYRERKQLGRDCLCQTPVAFRIRMKPVSILL